MWDADLARGAQAWADKCDFDHQHIRNQGENLYYAAPKTHSDDYYIHRALRQWLSEKSHNDGSFNCCYHNHYDCCHYTQVLNHGQIWGPGRRGGGAVGMGRCVGGVGSTERYSH